MMKRLTAAAVAASIAFFSMGGSAQADPYLQCVTFARMFSGIQLFGNAWTWWEQATGKYQKGFTPEAGAVLVFKPNGHMRLGHVAVVSHVLTDRIIQISHANWSPIDGGRGKVESDVTVVDVSQRGDWSQVKVWYNPLGDLGHTVYPTYGFIYQAAKDATHQLVAGAKPANTTAVAAR
ncbi:MAG: CHAP domain-containing protein [Proteobacteria bacterium]|nr:CHAP domain-containing protein [Pseudomonadota bacterium]